MNKNTELAFPGPMNSGLTKRELMAAIICAGFNANPHFYDESHSKIATMSVEQTDELLEQLAK